MSDERPGEVAVSLQYEGEGAPRVTAKGEGDVAHSILQIAEQHDIPIYRDKQLTQLLSQVELNMEIPEFLYLAVAEIIAFAYALKDKAPAPRDSRGPVYEHQPSAWDEWLE